jgi:hypothetical protein
MLWRARFALCEVLTDVLGKTNQNVEGKIRAIGATRMGSRLLASVSVLPEFLDATAVQHSVLRA